MRALAASPTFAIAATLAAYALAERLYARTRSVALHPVLVAVAVLIALLRLVGLPYAVYADNARPISYGLGLSVVALGVTLHLQAAAIARLGWRLAAPLLAGSLVGIVSAAGTARLLGASPAVVASLAPKSVTTPIAVAIAGRVGGLPPLTAVVVITVGIFGAVVGPAWLRLLGVRSPTAWGFAMGAAAHGVGTARAMEEGDLQGAASALAIGLNGLATALLTPPVLRLLLALS